MATVTLTEQEYKELKDLESEVPKLKEAANKNGYVIITRYDRDIPENSAIIDSYVDFILENFDRQYGDPKYGSFGYNSFYDTRSKREMLKIAIKSFIVKYINTTSKKPFSKVYSTLINFEDIEQEIKEVYNHKYFEEFGERINKFKEDESCLAHKIKTFEKTNEEKIKSLEKKVKDLQDFEYQHYNDKNKIEFLESQIKELEDKLDLYRETISTQKEEIQNLSNHKR